MKKLLLIALLLLPLPVLADTFAFTWDPVTTDTNGNQLFDLIGYKLYTSTQSGVYTTVAATVSAAATNVTINKTIPANYFAVVRAYNSAGEAANSNEVTFSVVAKKPAAAVNLQVN